MKLVEAAFVEPVEGDHEVEDVRDALDERVGLLAAQLHAVSAELVDTIAAYLAAGGAQAGFSSPSQWLSVRAGFTTTEARRLCALAGRVAELPTLMGHARAGRLSTGVLTTAARVVTTDNEARVAELVVSCTPAQAARVLSTYRSVTAPPDPVDGADAGDKQPDPGDTQPDPVVQPEPETWWRSWTDDAGRGRIDAALSPDVAALVDQAWAAARAAGEADQPVTPSSDPHDPHLDSFRRLSADEVASRWATTMLDHAHDHGLCRPGGDRHGVVIHIDVATLARVLGIEVDPTIPIGLGTHAFDPTTGRHLADHDVARFLCDADLHVLIHHNGVPLWMSNTTRTANRHQRRALRFRASGTGGCEYPGCTQTRYLDAHHVVYHSANGATALDNLVLLCGHHHRALHRGEFTITTTGDQRFTFTDRHRTHLGTTATIAGATGPPPALTDLPHQHHPPDPPPGLDPDTPRSETHGEQLTAYAIDVYLSHLIAA